MDAALTTANEDFVKLNAAWGTARDKLVAAKWAFHNAMVGVRGQVVAQFGANSTAVQEVGLKRKSERKRPGPKPGSKRKPKTPPSAGWARASPVCRPIGARVLGALPAAGGLKRGALPGGAERVGSARVMPDIVLATLNAKFIHSAFGLRYLMANLGPLQARTALLEFDINQRPLDIAEALLAREPKIVGLGIYVWNVTLSTELVALLKRLQPDLTIILGGPEVSHETQGQAIVELADYVITGEADLKFAEVCGAILDGRRPGGTKVIPAPLPDLSRLALPYELYTEGDIAHRLLYVEASRGCPFRCEFCLSSLDEAVRPVPLAEFLSSLHRLLARGARHFKFVDRTFNLSIPMGREILEFLLARHEEGMLFHFELVPDRLPEALREVIRRFPPGALQFELGVQTFNEAVAERIQRRQDGAKLEENFRFLREETGVHIHADLVLGLPGESLESLAAGFDRLIGLRPQEIQVGLLKRLRGAPIARHTEEWGMTYNPHPPYDLLRNRLLDFATMQRLRRFARYWDLVGNSGNFVETAPRLWRDSTPFAAFLRFSEWLFAQVRRTDSIALLRLTELLFRYLTTELQHAPKPVAETLWRDYQRGGHREKPGFLSEHLPEAGDAKASPPRRGPKRQGRHLT